MTSTNHINMLSSSQIQGICSCHTFIVSLSIMPDPISTNQYLFIFFILCAMCGTAPASAIKTIETTHALGAIR